MITNVTLVSHLLQYLPKDHRLTPIQVKDLVTYSEALQPYCLRGVNLKHNCSKNMYKWQNILRRHFNNENYQRYDNYTEYQHPKYFHCFSRQNQGDDGGGKDDRFQPETITYVALTKDFCCIQSTLDETKYRGLQQYDKGSEILEIKYLTPIKTNYPKTKTCQIAINLIEDDSVPIFSASPNGDILNFSDRSIIWTQYKNEIIVQNYHSILYENPNLIKFGFLSVLIRSNIDKRSTMSNKIINLDKNARFDGLTIYGQTITYGQLSDHPILWQYLMILHPEGQIKIEI